MMNFPSIFRLSSITSRFALALPRSSTPMQKRLLGKFNNNKTIKASNLSQIIILSNEKSSDLLIIHK